ncbi:hypothetical protein EST38_g694 [Candolleomyces aberdarensis]|uniref:Uncharacterized protein n=1 Tax=Candolleomyces aberdarensis TaxID=2316362 RepID=A0A4Q2E0H7_9AGAR|nr:hypothetical protein EST38_g694 [Candolleomyces aberdarensis]
MKVNAALLGGLLTLCSIPVQAQYFSEGWKPGQAVQDTATAANPASTGWSPGQKSGSDSSEGTSASSFDFNTFLVSTLNKLGFNVSLPEATGHGLWDERIPLITDANYQDLIVNEEFASDEEASKRTWALIITTSASNKADAISKFVDQMFDSAYNTSVDENDLPNVRWGRIDYFNVTYLTTKWNVWQAPYLVILKDRGQTLRFYRPTQIRVREDAFREFLLTEGYSVSPPWSGLWAPGGEREWILELFAVYMTKAYNVFTKVPTFLIYIISGGLGSIILSFMHRPSKEQRQNAIREAQEKAKRDAAAAAAAASPSTPKVEESSPTKNSQQESPKKKGKALKADDKSSKGSTSSVAESSSPERRSSPAKTRSSARQKKGKKATQ